ncbi:MAG: hypothetical protein DHS20C18_29620 [Saprospiraceae bacterium]|nr:MAG: hypothetical protein DHS20C18_29620 [Saprospiraceae bacterium]
MADLQKEEKPQNLKFTLSIEETNLIMDALGQMPFVRVHQLIAKIQQQAAGQLQNNQK